MVRKLPKIHRDCCYSIYICLGTFSIIINNFALESIVTCPECVLSSPYLLDKRLTRKGVSMNTLSHLPGVLHHYRYVYDFIFM